jgi:catechol 2,3-dioxygenase-like lactoylglutathione lyase family enzyme
MTFLHMAGVDSGRDRGETPRLRAVCIAFLVALSSLGFAQGTYAQLLNNDAPVIVGHYHLNVTSVDEHKRFWVDTLGGTAIKISGVDVIRFPDVFLFLREQPPTGPTRGTTFDHIGFAVPDVPALTTRVVANGYELTVGREPPPGETASPPTAGNYGMFSYLVGPDGVKVELVTNSAENPPPITHHHVHFVNRDFVAMQQWYMQAFNATLRPGETDFFIGADLPGVGYMLNFFSWLPAEDLVGTEGRAVDHVGFEVRNLEAFCAELEAKGIELTEPYRRLPELGGLATAKVTDPWGTVIELTEGLRSDASIEPLPVDATL